MLHIFAVCYGLARRLIIIHIHLSTERLKVIIIHMQLWKECDGSSVYRRQTWGLHLVCRPRMQVCLLIYSRGRLKACIQCVCVCVLPRSLCLVHFVCSSWSVYMHVWSFFSILFSSHLISSERCGFEWWGGVVWSCSIPFHYSDRALEIKSGVDAWKMLSFNIQYFSVSLPFSITPQAPGLLLRIFEPKLCRIRCYSSLETLNVKTCGSKL